MQYRSVICVSQDTNSICTADEKLKPNDRRPCNTTCGQWLVSHWSDDVSIFKYGKTHGHCQSLPIYLFFLLLKCTGSCNNATLTRRVWCSSSVCNQHERPLSTRRCILSTCTNGSIHKKLTTTSTRSTTISTLKSTKAELNPGVSRVTTISHKNTLTTTSSQKTTLSTKTSTIIDKKTSVTTTRLQKTSLLTQTSTTSPKKTLATNPGRIQSISTITKKVLTTQKATITTKKSSITTTVKTTTQQGKSPMKSPRRPG